MNLKKGSRRDSFGAVHIQMFIGFIFSGGNSGYFLEASYEVGIVDESGELTGFGNRFAGGEMAFGQRNALVDDIGAYRKSGMLLEQLADIFAAIMKLLLQLPGSNGLNQMPLDIRHGIADQFRHDIVRSVRGRVVKGVDEHKQLGCIAFGQKILSVFL
jgi:hypothetical protein